MKSVIIAAVSLLLPPDSVMNVAYVPSGTPDQTLDFYWPAEKPNATVLFIHGGSLQEAGDRRSTPVYRDVCVPFIKSGIACATMDYRLAPTSQWPAMPNDVASAIVKVRELISQRGGDPKRLFLFGHSSGCQLAAIVATNPEYLKRVSLSPADLAGVIPMGCTLDRNDAAIKHFTVDTIRKALTRDSGDRATYGTAENWLSANPAGYIGPQVPPVLVVLSQAERFMPAILEQGARFVRQLLEIGRPADLVIVPGRHMTSIQNVGAPGDPTFAAIIGFIRNGVHPE